MKNFYKEGATMTFTAPSGGVVSGVPVLIGALLVVPVASVAQTLAFGGVTRGVIEYTKTSAQAWTEGVKIYWDDSGKVFTTSSSSTVLVGTAAKAAANPSASGFIRLDGVAR